MKTLIGAALVTIAASATVSFATLVHAAENASHVQDILYARAFKLEKPYAHTWRKEQPQVSAGYILVLSVDRDFARPKQVAEPVLFVGNQTAERINAGDMSGHLVVLVPSDVDARGEMILDLNSALIWFGAPELPERIDAAQLATESSAAVRNGIKPLEPARLNAARRQGGKTLRLANREALEKKVAALLEQYSPNETDLIRGLKVAN